MGYRRRNGDIDGPNQSLVKSIHDLEQSLACGALCKLGTHEIYNDFFDEAAAKAKASPPPARSAHDQLQIWVEVLHDSRIAAEKLLLSRRVSPVWPMLKEVLCQD